MLNCKLCDFFKSADAFSQSKGKCVCEYTGFIFHKNIEDYDMENHPCYEYQLNTGVVKAKAAVAYKGEVLKLA